MEGSRKKGRLIKRRRGSPTMPATLGSCASPVDVVADEGRIHQKAQPVPGDEEDDGQHTMATVLGQHKLRAKEGRYEGEGGCVEVPKTTTLHVC